MEWEELKKQYEQQQYLQWQQMQPTKYDWWGDSSSNYLTNTYSANTVSTAALTETFKAMNLIYSQSISQQWKNYIQQIYGQNWVFKEEEEPEVFVVSRLY